MEKLTFKLEQFEGPLDLLLFLISKHKLNIYEIEISKLLEQYLATIEQAQMQDMDVASEFLEMASRLVYLKTISLLPRHEDEEKQLKQELTGQLLEYQACRAAAAALAKSDQSGLVFCRDPQPLQVDNTYALTHSPAELANAYLSALGKAQKRMPPPPEAFSAFVRRRVVSVTSRIIFVLKRLYRQHTVGCAELFSQSGSRSEMVATFLAVLELVKSKRVLLSEDNTELRFFRAPTERDQITAVREEKTGCKS